MTVPKTKKTYDGPKCGAKKRSGGLCTQIAGWGTDHAGEGRCKLHGGSSPIKHGRYSTIKRPRLKEILESLESDPDPLDLSPELRLLRALILDYIERYDEQTDALIAWHASFSTGFEKQYAEWSKAFTGWEKDWGKFQQDFAAYRTQVEQVQAHYRAGWPEPPALPFATDPPTPPAPEDSAQKPRRVTDILEVGKFITAIGALVERVEKRQQEGTITLATLDAVTEMFGVELVGACQETISDETVRTLLLNAVEKRWGTIVVPSGGSSGKRGA
jgi:hypothetical protein